MWNCNKLIRGNALSGRSGLETKTALLFATISKASHHFKTFPCAAWRRVQSKIGRTIANQTKTKTTGRSVDSAMPQTVYIYLRLSMYSICARNCIRTAGVD